jgi:hypothetical protein
VRIDGTSGRWAAAFGIWVASIANPIQLHGQTAGYLNFDELTDELRSIVNGSELAQMRSLGASHEGREIWLVELADRSGVPLDSRPGVLVVGNLSGDHVVGSQLALEAIRHLVGPGADEADLSQHVIYVVPRLNPDGAETMFAGARDGRRGNAFAYDDDNDGRTDEDGVSDLNGDGVVTLMRVADPDGAYMVDPDEPRLMKRADRSQGERGTHALYREGADVDGDGFIGEDGPGGVDLDRNFQHEYPYWDADAGLFMVSEPESRALMDFVLGHKNIAAVVTFGHSDNLMTPPDTRGALAGGSTVSLDEYADGSLGDVFDQGVYGIPFQQGGLRLRGAQPGRDNDPESGRRPEVTVNSSDVEYFGRVAEAYDEITGVSGVALNRVARGAFFQYAYFQFGVPSFSTPGWAVPEPEDAGEGDQMLLSAFEAEGIDAFVPWSAFSHPDLGPVEVGGFRPDALANPPADRLPELGAAHGAFVARLSTMLPRVRIAELQVESHGGGVFTVSADVVNEGYFPSSLQHGVVSRTVDPVLVQIQIDPDDIITGAAKSHRITKLDGSGARERVSWVIRGNAGSSVEVRVRAEKGGSDAGTIILGGDR